MSELQVQLIYILLERSILLKLLLFIKVNHAFVYIYQHIKLKSFVITVAIVNENTCQRKFDYNPIFSLYKYNL